MWSMGFQSDKNKIVAMGAVRIEFVTPFLEPGLPVAPSGRFRPFS